jgi:predicted amidohydrolase YtcJ
MADLTPGGSSGDLSPTGDLILHGGAVFDGRRVLPGRCSVAVRDGRVLAVGPDADVRVALRGGSAGGATAGAEVIDLAGRLLLPGFVDAHVHPVMAGVELLTCDLTGLADAAETLHRVRRYAEARPELPWITGGGWLKEHFPGGLPTSGQLDAVLPDRPVVLRDNSHHAVWVNSVALRLAGLPGGDPAGGGPASTAAASTAAASGGPPTGTLHEAEMDPVTALLPPSTPEELLAGLLAAQRVLHSVGVTGWQDAILGDYAGHQDPTGAYLTAAGRGLLTGRVVGALWWPRGVAAPDLPDVVAELVGRRAQVAAALVDVADGPGASLTGRFRATAVKVMQDGVVESRTAGLTDPYVGGGSGLSYVEPSLLGRVASALGRNGFQLHLHAIGDRAVRESLDALQVALADPAAAPDLRHQIAHLQVVDPADVGRFAALGVTANLQALWACHDPAMDELNIPLLGRRRAGWQYPFGDLARSGARLAMGSDWPVSTPDPLAAIEVAVTRRFAGSDRPPLLPGQRLGRLTALAAYTSGSAWVNHDDQAGRVRPGARADLVVLDRDVTDPGLVPSGEIAAARVDLTLIGGVPVWQRP